MTHYPEAIPNPHFPELEEQVLKAWKQGELFERSVEQRPAEDEFVFYDGPPFANGLPHYGHLLTGYVKDVFARYHTMKGKRVERRFGWDCHGLPAEMGAEKELGVSGRAAIEEYGIAQLSLNLTDINTTPVHVAFDEAVERARVRGIRVTGSELVGLLPLRVLTEAADHYLHKQERSLGIPDREKVKIAVKSLGLDDLAPFEPADRVIEYRIAAASRTPLLDMTLRGFSEETASESPAPGGGSISAYCGALGAALGTMVANLSAHKRGWDDKWAQYSADAVEGLAIQEQLLLLVDADTAAFNGIMDAYGLPKSNPDQKAARTVAIQSATQRAIDIPMQVARTALSAMPLLKRMADHGNPNSITDAGVGAMAIRTAVLGAIFNARVNAADLADKGYVSEVLAECKTLSDEVSRMESVILARVDELLKN